MIRRRNAAQFSLPLFHPEFLISLIFMTLTNNVIIRSVSAQVKPNLPPMFLMGGDLSKFSIPEDTPVGSVVYR